jgi:hypothetical protein
MRFSGLIVAEVKICCDGLMVGTGLYGSDELRNDCSLGVSVTYLSLGKRMEELEMEIQ